MTGPNRAYYWAATALQRARDAALDGTEAVGSALIAVCSSALIAVCSDASFTDVSSPAGRVAADCVRASNRSRECSRGEPGRARSAWNTGQRKSRPAHAEANTPTHAEANTPQRGHQQLGSRVRASQAHDQQVS
jgi:hypothetical protein